MTPNDRMEPGTSGTDDFSELRSRVSAAWDMDLFHDAAGRVVSALEDHLRRVQSGAGPVLNWADPCDNIDVARRCLAAGSAVDADRVAALTQTVLSRGQSLHHPRYIGHQVPAPSPLAGLFDAVGAITNQVMGVYEMGPFTTAIEHVMVDTLGQEIGWASGQFAGVATHGGSLANLTALLTARMGLGAHRTRPQSMWARRWPPHRKKAATRASAHHFCQWKAR